MNETGKKSELTRLPVSGLWKLLRPEITAERGRFTLFGLVVVLAAVAGLCAPVFQKQFIDSLTRRELHDAMIFFVLTAGAVASIRLLSVAEGYIISMLNTAVLISLKRRLLTRLLGLPANSISQLGGGYLSGRLMGDIDRCGYFFSAGTPVGIRNSLTLAGGMAMIAVFDWRIALGMLAIAPIYWLLVKYFSDRQFKLSLELCEERAESNRSVYDALHNITLVKASSAEREAGKRLDLRLDSIRTIQRNRFRLNVGFRLLLAVLPGICYLLLFFVGMRLIIAGEWSLGKLWALVCYMGYVFTPVQSLGAVSVNLQQSLAAARRLLQLLELMPEEHADCHPVTGHLKGAISVRDCGFAYTPGKAVFERVSFELAPGDKAVLVGPSGSGKSTLAALLLGLYRPTSGSVRVDGVEVGDYEQESYRRRIGYLSQVSEFFAGTLRENLLYGAPDGTTDDQLVAALERSGAGELLKKQPDGLASPVWENAANFSVGERLRLATARELLRDCDILILDESTANLDDANAKLLLDLIDEVYRDRTVLAISHRESTVCRFAKKIELKSGAANA
ncbi:MAG: ABC transporter ATP-binding protein [Victivallaceae bacterium]|nr:ABC transporter ATP-binding protein [Victivallaceae bacterium]